MPIAHIQSSDDKKTQKASYKRRRNQNSEITQLESLLPWSQKGSGIDKISVLRLTSAFLRFKTFWQSAYGDGPALNSQSKELTGFDRLFSEALDGFIMILSPTGEVVFVSEGIADSVGVAQQEVMGVSIYELTHDDDASTIQDSLKQNGPQLQQSRHFYIRFKSSITPGKKQLSKFGGTVMLQVSGKLRLSRERTNNELVVVGLVAECRRIESSSSILELRVPQTVFTSTTTMDLKILSIDTKMKTVTGFNTDIEGSVLTDFFHPSDNRRSIHCLKTLLITGQASSPIVRFMTHTGEWVWVQIQGLVRYETDNRTPKYLEATFKVICASNGSVKMIEQTELYGKCPEPGESDGIHADSRFNIPALPKIDSADAIVRSVEGTNVSEAVRDVLLHGRETALSSIPTSLDRLATWPEVVDAVVEYETSKGLPANYSPPYPHPEETTSVILPSSVKSPLSSSTNSPLSSSTNSPVSSSTNSPQSLSDITPSPLSSHDSPSQLSPLSNHSSTTTATTNVDSTDDPLSSLLDQVVAADSPPLVADELSLSTQPSPACSYLSNDTPPTVHSYYTPSPATPSDCTVPSPQSTYMHSSPHMHPSPPPPLNESMYYTTVNGAPATVLTPLHMNVSAYDTPTNGSLSHMYMSQQYPVPNIPAYPGTFNSTLYPVPNPYSIEGVFQVNNCPQPVYPPHIVPITNYTTLQEFANVSQNF